MRWIGLKHRAHEGLDAVSQDNLFKQADAEEGQPGNEVAEPEPVGVVARKLRHHFRVVQHWPRNQMRKKSDEQGIRNEP